MRINGLLAGFRTLAALAGAFAGSPLLQAQTPVVLNGGTVNSADYSRSFAPGALISIFGNNLASSTAQPGAFPLPTTLGGTSVELVATGQQFPLWYVSPGQINAQMPYDVPAGQAQIRVRTAAGTSNIDTITVSARAPKLFTLDFSGAGPAVATTPSFQILSQSIPAKPADTIVLWMNSMGASSGNPIAGEPAPGGTPGSQPSIISGVTATINGQSAPVIFAGLSPGSAGLYQVNVQAPFAVITGPVTVQVSVGGAATQASVTIPYRQLGFYFSLLGGKTVTGQTLNGVSGTNSALAFRHSDQLTWGTTGLNAWTKNTGLGSEYSAVTGLALTLRNGASVVYDNNGIDTGSTSGFYDNTNGPANSKKPGLSNLYSMSNYFPMSFAGYFRLSASTTVTELTGYFDVLGNLDLPFDPANGYIRYRMNIWSSASGSQPRETGNFTGDVFSSDTTPGTFTFSDTGVKMISSNPKDAPKSIYRLSYRLASPMNLPAGEYWFSHDASVRPQPAAGSTQALPVETAQIETPDAPLVGLDDFSQYIGERRPVDSVPMRVSVFGREMTYRNSWHLPGAVVIRPSAIVKH